MGFDGFISYSHAADGRLAPAVQHGLHRLAKPWHRRRALWIFRDQTGLAVTPALWSSIQTALDGSEWFVLLASPEAARSPWVNREIEHWIATKPADRILPVVTDGRWRWDAERGDLAADSTAVPDALRGVFTEEPLFLDLRWARDDRHLGLRHAQFRDAVAQLAAPMHGVSKDELVGEDVRQHRRTRRLRSVAVAALVLLAMVASLTGVVAGRNADRATAAAVEARRQQQAASHQRGNAERSASEAQRQEENARVQEARARAAATETKRQEKRARQQQGAAARAAAEADRQQRNARRQTQLAKRAQSLAGEQQAVAREQSELAQQSARETTRQKIIAQQQQRLAAEAAAETERQRTIAKRQQRMAEEAGAEARRQELVARENERKATEAAAEARRQESIARHNEQKAKEAGEEARRQEENAAEQKRIAIGRGLVNRAKATVGNDPTTALQLGLAAQRIHPGNETRGELAGLVSSTRQLGAVDDALRVAYGPNDVLAVVHSDFSASLWNVANRAKPVRLARLDGEWFVGQPVFSPDGKTLAIGGGWDFEPIIFDVSRPAQPTRLGTIPAPFAGWLTFSPDGQTLAVVTIDNKWTLWDMTNRESPTLLTEQNTGYGSPITFSPDGHTIVTAGTPGIVWDITDRTRPTEVGTLDGTWRQVTFSPTRPLLVTSDDTGNFAAWHMDDRAKPRKFSTKPGRTYVARFSGDGLTLATGDGDGTARLWDMTRNAPVHLTDLNDHGGYAESLEFSPDGRTLATTGAIGTLRLWAVRAPGEPTILGRARGTYRSQLAAALTSDGQRLTTVNFDGTATVFDVSLPALPVERATMRIHPTHLDAAAVSPSGDLIAAVGLSEGSVTLTDSSDPRTPVPLGVLPVGPWGAPLVFSPDGRTLAVDHGLRVALWDLADRRRPAPLPDLPVDGPVDAIAISPDSRTVAVATERAVQLWNMAERSNPVRFATLKGHSNRVLAVAFSPDGSTLATGSADQTAALWNIADQAGRRRHAILTGNGAPVWSVAFTPDGRTLATGTADDGAAFWDVTELSAPVRVASLRRAELRSESLLFHPDGRTMTTVGPSYSGIGAVVWDYTALNELRADPAGVACAITGGGFTPDEWAALVPEAPYQPTCSR